MEERPGGEQKNTTKNVAAEMRKRVPALLLLGILLAGFTWLQLTYFVPVTGGVDQNGYHASGRILNLDGVSFRKTGDALEYVGSMWVVNERGEFYPKYPPFYPLLSAGMNLLLGPGGGFYATLWGAVLAVAGMYALARFWMGRYHALAAAALLALSPVIFALGLTKNSHTPSLAFFLWGMASFMLGATRRNCPAALLWAALGGFLIGCTVGIRYTDFLLIFIPAAACMLTPRNRRWKLLAALAAGAALPYAALALFHLQAYGAPWRSGYSLTSESGAFSPRFLLQNFQIYLPEFFTLVIGPIGVLALLVWRFRWKRLLFWAVWLLPTGGLYLMYYWAPDGESTGAMRFLVPLVPAVILLSLLSLQRLLQRIGNRPAVILTLVLLFAVQGVWAWTRITRFGEQRYASDIQRAFIVETVKHRVPANAVIIANTGMLDELDYERRWTLYPSYLLAPREIERVIENSLGARAAGLQKTRAERLKREVGGLNHGKLYEYLRNFFEQKQKEGKEIYFLGRTQEVNRFRRSFYRHFEVENLGMLTGTRPAWLLRDVKPNASRYRPRAETVPLTPYELVKLGSRRSRVLPADASTPLLTTERSEILSRINPENDQELARELVRLESIRDDLLNLRRSVTDAAARKRERELRSRITRLEKEIERLKKRPVASPSKRPAAAAPEQSVRKPNRQQPQQSQQSPTGSTARLPQQR